MHVKGVVRPIIPRGNVLVLAGGTGPMSSIAVQTFYWWCSRNFEQVYTVVETQDVGQKILPNVYTLNDRSHRMLGGWIISGDKYDRDARILVHPELCLHRPVDVQVFEVGTFSFVVGGIKCVANNCHNPLYRSDATLTLQ